MSCSLFLVRHAVAAERGDDYPDDTLRPLTSRGTSRFKRVARGLAALDPGIEVILSSPLVRARQTADLLSRALPGRLDVVETDALVPGGAFRDLLGELARHADASGIALVGHEPGIGGLASRLMGFSGTLEFKKGGVCRIDVDQLPPESAGVLRWFLPPRVLARIGR